MRAMMVLLVFLFGCYESDEEPCDPCEQPACAEERGLSCLSIIDAAGHRACSCFPADAGAAES